LFHFSSALKKNALSSRASNCSTALVPVKPDQFRKDSLDRVSIAVGRGRWCRCRTVLPHFKSTKLLCSRHQGELDASDLGEVKLGLRDRSSTLKSNKIGPGADDLASQSLYMLDPFRIRSSASGKTVTERIPARPLLSRTRARASATTRVATIGGNLSVGSHGLGRL
jgi:hypothetical protein